MHNEFMFLHKLSSQYMIVFKLMPCGEWTQLSFSTIPYNLSLTNLYKEDFSIEWMLIAWVHGADFSVYVQYLNVICDH